MKLYATVTSERASKGQGGNKYIETLISTGSSRESIPALNLKVFTQDDGSIYFQLLNYKLDKIEAEGFLEKGNKQKGECPLQHNFDTEIGNDGLRQCLDCPVRGE